MDPFPLIGDAVCEGYVSIWRALLWPPDGPVCISIGWSCTTGGTIVALAVGFRIAWALRHGRRRSGASDPA